MTARTSTPDLAEETLRRCGEVLRHGKPARNRVRGDVRVHSEMAPVWIDIDVDGLAQFIEQARRAGSLEELFPDVDWREAGVRLASEALIAEALSDGGNGAAEAVGIDSQGALWRRLPRERQAPGVADPGGHSWRAATEPTEPRGSS